MLWGIFKLKKSQLVVGIVVDQMRYDYVYRFWNQFGDNGFKKLVNEGYFLRNTHYNLPQPTQAQDTLVYLVLLLLYMELLK